MLRTTEREVSLEVCRPPPGTFTVGEDTSDGGSGVISTSLTLPSTSHHYLSPSPSFSSYGVRHFALKEHLVLDMCRGMNDTKLSTLLCLQYLLLFFSNYPRQEDF